MRRHVFDDIDWKIISHLQKDGRRPYTAIAKDLGISEAGVRQRVARLIKNRTIQIVATSNPVDLGLLSAQLTIEVAGDRLQAVADAMAALPEVDYVAMVAGAFDLHVGVVCHDREELQQVLIEKIRPIPGVLHSEVFLVLRVLKDVYQWTPTGHPQE